MTDQNAEQLLRELRLAYIRERREDDLWKRCAIPDRRAELKAATRKMSARLRTLFQNPHFQRVLAAYSAAYGQNRTEAVDDLMAVIAKVSCFKMLYSKDFSPKELWEADAQQAVAPAQIMEQLRKLGQTLNPALKASAEQLARDVEAQGRFSLKNVEIGAIGLDLENNIGRRGGASDPEGAWRALFIRETAHMLPRPIEKFAPYATIAGILVWAGIPKVTPNLVRATLRKGRT